MAAPVTAAKDGERRRTTADGNGNGNGNDNDNDNDNGCGRRSGQVIFRRVLTCTAESSSAVWSQWD